MQKHLFQFINPGRRLPAGRASFALAKMRTLLLAAAAVNAPNLRSRMDTAQAEAKKTLHMDLRWAHTRAQTRRARGEAVEVDREVDQTVKAIFNRLQSDAVGQAQDPEVAAANLILQEVFPHGYSTVTRQAFDIQLASVDTILERLEDDLDSAVQTLGLSRHVQNLRSLNEQFRVELDHENGRPLQNETVVAQRDRLHAALCHVIAAAFVDLYEPTAENVALLDVFFEPLQVQLNATLAANRRQRDINPKTGEELDNDTGVDHDEPADSQQLSEA